MSEIDITPTEITQEDIQAFFEKLLNGAFDLKLRPCFKCSNKFLPNYNDMECDECWFSRFPKEQVQAFCRSFFE